MALVKSHPCMVCGLAVRQRGTQRAAPSRHKMQCRGWAGRGADPGRHAPLTLHTHREGGHVGDRAHVTDGVRVGQQWDRAHVTDGVRVGQQWDRAHVTDGVRVGQQWRPPHLPLDGLDCPRVLLVLQVRLGAQRVWGAVYSVCGGRSVRLVCRQCQSVAWRGLQLGGTWCVWGGYGWCAGFCGPPHAFQALGGPPQRHFISPYMAHKLCLGHIPILSPPAHTHPHPPTHTTTHSP